MKFTLSIRVMKKCDLSGLSECGMNDGARRAGLSVSQTADLLGFSKTTIVYREWFKRKKRKENNSNDHLAPKYGEEHL